MIRIGTRGSKLALIQAHWVSSELASKGTPNEVIVLKTKGDVIQDRFDKIEGKGFFTKEIEYALLQNHVDLAVHCLKDLPTDDAPGLAIRAVPERENPMDVLVSARPLPMEDGAPDLNGLNVGTSSNRRVQGLARLYPEATFSPLRGNVPTRIQKMKDGEADCIVLARAGLNRLNMTLEDVHVYDLEPPLLAPAPGQGALALQTRADSSLDLSHIHHEESARCTTAERRVLNALEGGCQLPLGVLIQPVDGAYQLDLFLGEMGGPTRPANPLVWRHHGPDPETLATEALARIHQHRG